MFLLRNSHNLIVQYLEFTLLGFLMLRSSISSAIKVRFDVVHLIVVGVAPTLTEMWQFLCSYYRFMCRFSCESKYIECLERIIGFTKVSSQLTTDHIKFGSFVFVPRSTFCPPITKHVPLHCKPLCKLMLRASGECK